MLSPVPFLKALRMLSAIVGDVIGSRFENAVATPAAATVPLAGSGCTYTDDTICTLAIGQWLLDDPQASPGPWLRRLCQDHSERGFGAHFLHWLRHSDAPDQASFGNGAAMRVSPVAFFADTDEEAMALAERSLHPTHLHPHSVEGARATVWAIRQAFAHRDPERLLREASARFSYGDLLGRDPVAERATHAFDITVQGTVPLALVLAARGGSFEGTMRLAILMGGDSDTLAAIAGPIAEGLYGRDDALAQKALSKMEFWFDPRLWGTLLDFYAHPRVVAFHRAFGRDLPPLQDWHHQGPTF